MAARRRKGTREDATSTDTVWEFMYYQKFWDKGEPGEVLRGLARAAGVPYGQTSRAIIALEEMGLVQVERMVYPYPCQSNRIVSVRAMHIGSRRRAAA